jgi:hypothetical protein
MKGQYHHHGLLSALLLSAVHPVTLYTLTQPKHRATASTCSESVSHTSVPMDTDTLHALSDFDNPQGQLATLPALNEDLALAMDRHEVGHPPPGDVVVTLHTRTGWRGLGSFHKNTSCTFQAAVQPSSDARSECRVSARAETTVPRA